MTRWRVLLDGELRRRALETIEAIAVALREVAARDDLDPSLMQGRVGLALFFAYLARAGLDGAAAALAGEQLDQAIDAVADRELNASLYHGLTGVAWLAAHLQEPDDTVEDPNQDVDELLLAHLENARDLELMRGLVGIGVYALERLPRPGARAMLARVVTRLDEAAERRAGGVTWWTPPEGVPVTDRATFPRGYYNLGLAHGVPGMIALLARACAVEVLPARARALLEGAVPWLLEQRLPRSSVSGRSRLPMMVAPGWPEEAARHAWCYGDPGVAAALLLAARATRRGDWAETALELARGAAQAEAGPAGVLDACLCHGAAGLGHLLNRMAQATGDSALAEGARRWLAETLDLRQPGQGVAGFSTWVGLGGGRSHRVAEPGFLIGAAGIGLALLAAVSDVEPAWDRLLLVSM